jgi:hypothetical protein
MVIKFKLVNARYHFESIRTSTIRIETLPRVGFPTKPLVEQRIYQFTASITAAATEFTVTVAVSQFSSI